MSFIFTNLRSYCAYLLLVLITGATLTSCQKEETINPDTQILLPPIITYPPQGSQQTNCILIKWNTVNNAQAYTLQVATDTLFSYGGSIILQTTVYDASQILITLNQGGQYYARLSAINQTQTSSAWSAIHPFSVNAAVLYNCQPETMLIAPKLISPQQESVLQGNTQTFTWESVPGAATYHLQIATTPNFAGNVYSNINIVLPTRTIQQFNAGTTYYWRVKAVNNVYQSAWSETGKFSIAP